MIDLEKIRAIAEEQLQGSDLFIVSLTASPANEIELLVDSDTSVGIDQCVALNRAVEAAFDRDTEDFELTVASAGIGQPLRTLRQYLKLVGRPVEVVLRSGSKLVATLREATDEALTLEYTEKVAVEGKKRKETVTVTRTYPLAEIKLTREHIDFK